MLHSNSLILFVFCVKLIESEDVFVVVGDVCVTNSSSSITVDHLKVPKEKISEYKPEPEECIRDNCMLSIDNWFTVPYHNKNDYYNQIITDRRWEEFSINETNYAENKYYLQYDFIDKFDNKEKLTIPFSVKIAEAHVFICESNYVNRSKCLWLIIGGWQGRVIGLRSCPVIAVPNTCNHLVVSYNDSSIKPYVSEDLWSNYMIEKDGDIWKFWKDETLLFKYRANITWGQYFLFVHGKRSKGYWKFHKGTYFYAKESSTVQFGKRIKSSRICISMFVNLCKECYLRINCNEINSQYYYNLEGRWKEIKYITNNSRDGQFYIHNGCDNCTSSTNKQFWYISHPRYCNENFEYRLLKASSSSTFNLLEKNNPIDIRAKNATLKELNCNETTFGKACIPCNLINGREKCNRYKFCEYEGSDLTCSCTAGYFGQNCEKKCALGAFGFGCEKQCGNCVSHCDVVTGNCSSCKENFIGNKCDIPPSPIFKYPPKVIEVGNVNCRVYIENSDVYGNVAPKDYFYEITLFSNWTTYSDLISFGKNPQTLISNLSPDANYKVRAIIVDVDGNSYKGTFVKFSEFRTKCKDIDEQTLSVTTTKYSANICIETDPEMCPLSSYTFFYNHNNTIHANNRQINITNLHPFTTYTFEIKRQNKTVLTKEIKTKPGPPGKIGSPEGTSTHNTINLFWNPPNQPNGEIKSYKISYYKNRNLGCLINEENPEVIEGMTDTNKYVMKNLHPFAMYNVTITAVTVETGEPFSFFQNTNSTDVITSHEIPTKFKILNASIPVKIQFETINCNLIQGPIMYKFFTTCLEKWCPEKSKTTYTKYNISDTQRRIFTFPNLIPFSNYALKMEVCRSDKKCSNDVIERRFVTPPSVPNAVRELKVYSKDSTFISLNWLPPYPPTGVLLQYKIEYKYETKYVLPTPCPLWPYLHCAIIRLDYKNYNINIKVSATNDEPSNLYGEFKKIETVQKLDVSEAPYNLTAIWDENFKLRLSWNHPNVTNGNLYKFRIQLSNIRKNEDFIIKGYESIYEYPVRTELNPSTNYTIKVTGFNMDSDPNKSLRLEGKPALTYTITPPEFPELTDNMESQESGSNTTLKVHLPGLKNLKIKKKKEENFYMFMFINTTSSETNRISKQNIKSKYTNKLQFPPENLVLMEDVTAKRLEKVNYVFLRTEEDFEIIDLLPATHYNVTVFLISEFFDKFRLNKYSQVFRTNGEPIGPNHALLALILLVVLPIVALFGYNYIRKKRGLPMKPDFVEKMLSNAWNSSVQNITESDDTLDLFQTELKPPTKPKKPSEIPTSTKSKPEIVGHSKIVQVADFEEYVKVSIENGELLKQHNLFPRGKTKPWDNGMLPVNKPKNRYNNLIAYDHSRVKLEKVNDDEYSDYINANYIDGHKVPKAYIATQGPKSATSNDFWRMIWQENVKHIIMLANIIEGGKKKVEKYWPDINNAVDFNGITVEFVYSKVFADYELRTFNVSFNGIARKIEQLHFTSWPDHGVPLYSQSLVPFLRRMLTIPTSTKSPVVIHCSAGVGRTGTIILCDTALRMAAREGALDLLNILDKMRSRRPNMVDNVEQYKLAHLVVLECLVGLQTSISCNEHMEVTVNEIIKSSGIPKQMKYLVDTTWQDEAMKSVAEECEEIPNCPEKNRSQDIVPEIQGRVFLSRYPNTDEKSSFINAVFVDGFKAPGRFIVTQNPLPNTVGDFWRLVSERLVNTILSLNEINKNDNTCCQFWPTKESPEMNPVDYITLKYNKSTTCDYYDIISVNVQCAGEVEMDAVNILQMKHWPPRAQLPRSTANILSFWQEADVIGRNSEHVIVTCFDGAKASGIYLATSFVIDKMNMEQELDICQAVRNIRHNRKQFIQSEEQFKFLYKTAVDYIKSFQSYANFN